MWLQANGDSRCPEPSEEVPDHAGLGYTRCAPLAVLVPTDKQRRLRLQERWLNALTRCPEPRHYQQIFYRWRRSFQGPDTLCFVVRAVSRVLVGHGTSSATEVGLTLHHTLGVPVLPGSALKGLTAQYVQTDYGPESDLEEPEREPFRGTTWKDSRPTRPPGAVFRRLFGSPDVDGLEEGHAGEVIFHDALWVPAKEPMLARDVLTVHQRAYYESGGTSWPVDHDDPNPVSFLTVAPGHHFLVALESRGGRELLDRAARYLCEALAYWGVGGKTVAGYGRFVRVAPEQEPASARPPPVSLPETPALNELRTWLEAQKEQQSPQRQQFQQVEREWSPRLMAMTPPERLRAAQLLQKFLKIKHPDDKPRLDELLAKLRK